MFKSTNSRVKMTNLWSPNFLITPAESIEGANFSSARQALNLFLYRHQVFARTMFEQPQPMLSSK